MTNVNSKVMEGSTSADKVPLSALRNATRSLISSMLNPCKILPSPSKYPRDYRGLAYLCNLPLPPCNSCDSTASVLKSWEKLSNPTVADFISALETIDRWDVIDDIEELLSKDLEQYSQIGSEPQELSNPLNSETDQHILTVDDVLRIEKGLEPQFYDAFLLYSDEDVDFATQMIDRLENHYELKLCIKERDLVGGVTFEHEAIMRLISERCRRVILIISPSFIESPANRFFVNYSQALGIEQSQRKIIPCVYKPTSLPRLLTYYTRLDFNRTSPLWNFWDKLTASIRSPLPGETSRNVVQSSVKITELPDPIQWDCPEKSARRLPSLPAIGEGDARAASNPKTDAVCLPRGSEPVELSQATKSKTFSLTNLLPSPPTNKLKKIKWWKKKKVRVPEASSF